MASRSILVFLFYLPCPILFIQAKGWVEEWTSMPADTQKVRSLQEYFKADRQLSADSLILLAKQGYELAEELNDQAGMGIMMQSQGVGHCDNGNFNVALPLFQQAKEIFLAIGDHKRAGGSLTNIGLVHYHLGRSDEALMTYLEAATQYSLAQQPDGRLYNNIAIVYREQEKYDRAIEYYEKSLDLRRANEDSVGMANVWFNLANLKLYQKDTLQAIELARQALDAYQVTKQERDIASTQVLLAVLYRRSGQREQIASALEAAWTYYEVHPQGRFYMICLMELADLYSWEKNWKKAGEFYQQAIQLSYEWELENDRAAILEHYSVVLKEIGQTSAAYDSLAKSYELMRTLTKEERLELTEEMQARFEVQQAEEREQVQAEAFAKEQQQSRVILTLIGLLLSGAVIFLLVNVRKNRRLELKQRQVEQALEEKEAIMREMHHRIKNNLQFLSSLLRLQARHLDDRQARDALLHSRSRVLSMALIHKHLYEDEGKTAIRMDAYLEKLIKDVMGSLDQPNREIRFDLLLDPLILDVDKAIPVALITHEAIMNSLKYAFEGRKSGSLSVSLTAHEQKALLSIQDDGIGVQSDRQGFGQRLMQLLTERLEGEIRMISDAGYSLQLEFPLIAAIHASS